jgi:hypothetical protein
MAWELPTPRKCRLNSGISTLPPNNDVRDIAAAPLTGRLAAALPQLVDAALQDRGKK